MKPLMFIVSLLTLMQATHAAHAADFALVESGQPKVEIVYVNEPSPIAISPSEQSDIFEAAVDDLVRVLEVMTGAKVTARPANADDTDATGTIQIGHTPAAKKAGLVDRISKHKNHALLIHSVPETQTLYLTGSTLEGSGHAIYVFLESLGCRWYYPGEEGENIPKAESRSITISKIDRVEEPAFERRAIQLSRTSPYSRQDNAGRAAFMDWMRRNKFGGTSPSRGHSFNKIIGNKYETHPEYYALRDGKRTQSHICMTHPDVADAAVEHLTTYFTDNPDAKGFPVALADGAQYCECPDCTEACGGNPRDIMDLYLKFTGEVFDRVQKKFPDREFQYGFYVYSNLMAPPTRKVPSQLAPYIAPLGYDPFHTFLPAESYKTLSVFNDFPKPTQELILTRPRNYLLEAVREAIEGWANGTDNVYLRDYDPYITFAQNMPIVRIYQLAIELPWYKQVGVRGFTPEAVEMSQYTSGLNFWVRSRYYWDTSLDIKDVLREYCDGMFGEAADPMYSFIDALARRTVETTAFRHGDRALTRLYTVEFARELGHYLDRAEALATTDQAKTRVHMWRLCQQYMIKYLQTREAELRGNFVDARFLCQDFLKFNDYVESVNPHYIGHRWYSQREFSMFAMNEMYQRLAEKQDGTTGRLITRLPLNWYVKHDPESVGVKEKWQSFEPLADVDVDPNSADWDPSTVKPVMPGWELMPSSQSWQTKAEHYEGFNWFRTQAPIPASAKGKTVHMLVTGIFGHMDFFINGQRVQWEGVYLNGKGEMATGKVQHLDNGGAWSWNYNETFEVDVTSYLKPGEVNTFTFRSKDRYRWGGIFKSVSLFEPLNAEPIEHAAPNGVTTLSRLKRTDRCDCADGHAF